MSTPPTSHTLLQRHRDADAEAWRRLHFLYDPLVRYWASRWGVPSAEVDDLVQEVFAAVAGGLPAFRRDREGDTFRGWLRGIARFKALDAARGRSRRPVASGGTDAQRAIDAVADPLGEIGDDPREQTAGLFQRALQLVRDEFEEKTWGLFWRVAVDGHPVEVVAADAGVSAAGVRKAKSRVLRRLKEELGEVIE